MPLKTFTTKTRRSRRENNQRKVRKGNAKVAMELERLRVLCVSSAPSALRRCLSSCSPCLRGEIGLPQFGDDPERLGAARHALAIVEGVAPALRMVVPSRAGRMRAEDRILQREQLVIGLRRLF